MQQGAARCSVLAPARNISWWISQIARPLTGGHDQRDAAVNWHIAIVKAQRFSDPARIEIVFARHRLRIEECARIEVSVAPAVECQRRQCLARRAVTMHVALPR